MRPKRAPPQVTRSLFFKAPGHQVTFFHEKIKTTQVTGRFFKLSRSRGRPQNGPRSQVAKTPSWASPMVTVKILQTSGSESITELCIYGMNDDFYILQDHKN